MYKGFGECWIKKRGMDWKEKELNGINIHKMKEIMRIYKDLTN